MRLEGLVYRVPGPHPFSLGPLDVLGPDDRPWVVLGPAGAGKTTLLRLLGGGLKPTSGRCHGLRPGEESGYVPQLPERALAGRNLAEDLCGELRPSTALRAQLRDALRSVGLEHLSLSRRSRELSTGERRRLTLALLHLSPRCNWCLDEPDAGLDGRGRRALASWIGVRAQRGRLWIATHRPELYRDPPPFLLVLDRGRLISAGPGPVVLQSPGVRGLLGIGAGVSPSPEG